MNGFDAIVAKLGDTVGCWNESNEPIVLDKKQAATLYYGIVALKAAVRDLSQGVGLEPSRDDAGRLRADTAFVAHYSVAVSLPTKTVGVEKAITQETKQELEKAYPSVDVGKEFLQMRAWLLANPKKRKTERGMLAFVNRWLKNAETSKRKKSHRASSDQDYFATNKELFSEGD